MWAAYFICTTTCTCRFVVGRDFLRTKLVYTFERMKLNRAITCVEFSFSELAREIFYVTMESVNCKVSIFFTAATKIFSVFVYENVLAVAMST